MMEYIVHNLFSTEAGVVWLVLKWALVVLAAGFIGQFGKAFATYLIRRAREGKAKDTVPAARHEAPPPAVRAQPAPPAALRDAGPVAESAPGAVPEPAEAARLREAQDVGRSAREKEEKKALKEEQKARKKALKGIKKLFK
jgi:hypothetical protein